MHGCLAVLNAGSSSIKFALYEGSAGAPAMFRGQVEGIGVSPRLRVFADQAKPIIDEACSEPKFDHELAATTIVRTASRLLEGTPVVAVGHRVVHGGTAFSAPVRVDDKVIASLRELVPLAPLHQPHNIAPIRAIAERAPHITQVACFDTAFHQGQPRLSQTFALPHGLTAAGIRRYGFHGLSYEYVASRLAEIAPDLAASRVIIAHLGNGASLCAVHEGRSIASTMGFTAVDGLMMGTRCGAIDPGVLIYLMDEHGMDARAIEDLIYRQSGLLGVSGISSDMRTLRASRDPRAVEAIGLFVYRIIREVGSLAAALGGLDCLVFTGGIGEHDTATRAEVAVGCKWLGVRLDHARNARAEPRISAAGSSVAVWVIPTDEERMIARHTSSLLG